jgi:branched-chain amino acid transport system ATP-binding protein
MALALADHAYMLETGTIALEGAAGVIGNNESVRRVYLGY